MIRCCTESLYLTVMHDIGGVDDLEKQVASAKNTIAMNHEQRSGIRYDYNCYVQEQVNVTRGI